MDELRSLGANHSTSEDPTIGGIGDQFDEPIGLALNKRLAVIGKGVAGCDHLGARAACLDLGHAAGCHLRLGEGSEELEPVVERDRLPSLEQCSRIFSSRLTLGDRNMNHLIGPATVSCRKKVFRRSPLF